MVARRAIAVEISTAGLRKPVGELYPDADLLRGCARTGAPVTLASDAHEPELVGADFDQALVLARRRLRDRRSLRPRPDEPGAARMTWNCQAPPT